MGGSEALEEAFEDASVGALVDASDLAPVAGFFLLGSSGVSPASNALATPCDGEGAWQS